MSDLRIAFDAALAGAGGAIIAFGAVSGDLKAVACGIAAAAYGAGAFALGLSDEKGSPSQEPAKPRQWDGPG